jgi:hypothetical protein
MKFTQQSLIMLALCFSAFYVAESGPIHPNEEPCPPEHTDKAMYPMSGHGHEGSHVDQTHHHSYEKSSYPNPHRHEGNGEDEDCDDHMNHGDHHDNDNNGSGTYNNGPALYKRAGSDPKVLSGIINNIFAPADKGILETDSRRNFPEVRLNSVKETSPSMTTSSLKKREMNGDDYDTSNTYPAKSPEEESCNEESPLSNQPDMDQEIMYHGMPHSNSVAEDDSTEKCEEGDEGNMNWKKEVPMHQDSSDQGDTYWTKDTPMDKDSNDQSDTHWMEDTPIDKDSNDQDGWYRYGSHWQKIIRKVSKQTGETTYYKVIKLIIPFNPHEDQAPQDGHPAKWRQDNENCDEDNQDSKDHQGKPFSMHMKMKEWDHPHYEVETMQEHPHPMNSSKAHKPSENNEGAMEVYTHAINQHNTHKPSQNNDEDNGDGDCEKIGNEEHPTY